MKLTIIGGSRGTGAQLATIAQAAGHEVTVVSRSGLGPAGVQTVAADATNLVNVSAAVTGADAVFVTVGAAKTVHHQRAAVTRNVIAAMQGTGTTRLIVQSSLGAGGSASQLPAPLALITRLLLAKPLADHNEQETAVMSSGLDWTIVRPTGLKNQPASGTPTVLELGERGTLRGSISRQALATLMLDLATKPQMIGKALAVSS